MNAEDHAILVGIRRYPGLGINDQGPLDLQGSETDALALCDWLVDPAKGGLPKGNIKCILTADFEPFASIMNAGPLKNSVVAAFKSLYDLAEHNRQTNGSFRAGRRLYVYMSGHGFAPNVHEVALLMANATIENPHHVYATAWSDWFFKAAIFDEFVLWMDCCCQSFDTVLLELPTLEERLNPRKERKVFSAFAARFPKTAVETIMSDGKVHGVFTYTLLQGLTGRAVDERSGQINTDSLRSYLTRNMRLFMTDSQRELPTVSKVPDFGDLDQIDFGAATIPKFDITVNLDPTYAGASYTLMDSSFQEVSASNISLPLRLNLARGLYLLDIREPSILRKPFEVSGVDNETIKL
jgi:hypothetical protein